MKTRRGPWRYLAASLLAVVLTGCAQEKSSDGAATLPTFKPDIATWRMPLDAYVVNPGKTDYARSLVYGACLRGKGFTPPPPALPGSNLTPVYNTNGRKLFNLDLARRFGYHNGPPNGKVAHEGDPKLPGEATARVECAQEATAALGTSDEAAALVYSFKTAAYQDAIHSEKWIAAGKRWRKCMLPLGIPDLPTTFEDGVMPTDSQRSRFGMRASDAADAPLRSFVPTTVAEVREAEFDAKCRESSGLTPTLYELEVSNQERIISNNREELGRSYRLSQEGTSNLDKIIKKYAG